ncbi:uncharacterized protein LOC135496025 [Lineus longissimus]|uniref:uncharacterized protein LOC135496025 n=1 Tax=Lineus longissimus TaxID=88925 RepID=UPI00315DA1BA
MDAEESGEFLSISVILVEPEPEELSGADESRAGADDLKKWMLDMGFSPRPRSTSPVSSPLGRPYEAHKVEAGAIRPVGPLPLALSTPQRLPISPTSGAERLPTPRPSRIPRPSPSTAAAGSSTSQHSTRCKTKGKAAAHTSKCASAAPAVALNLSIHQDQEDQPDAQIPQDQQVEQMPREPGSQIPQDLIEAMTNPEVWGFVQAVLNDQPELLNRLVRCHEENQRMVKNQPHQPIPANMPRNCKCGRCRQMPSVREQVCCGLKWPKCKTLDDNIIQICLNQK